MEVQYEKFCEQANILGRLRHIRKELLGYEARQIYIHHYEQALRAMQQQKKQQSFIKFGNHEAFLLQDVKQIMIVKKNTLSQEEAKEYFQESWQKINKEINQEIQSQVLIQQQKLFNIIELFYSTKSGGQLPIRQEEVSIMRDAFNNGTQIDTFIYLFESLAKKGLFFNQKSLKGLKFSQFNNLNKHVVNKYFEFYQFFQKRPMRTYLKWTKCWKPSKFDKYLIDIFYNTGKHQILDKLIAFIEQLKIEADIFGLTFSKNIQNKLLNLLNNGWRGQKKRKIIGAVRYQIIHNYKKEGKIFSVNRKSAIDREAITSKMNLNFFNLNIPYQYSVKEKVKDFQYVYIGESQCYAPKIGEFLNDQPFQQFLNNFLNQKSRNVSQDSVERAIILFSKSIKWERALQQLSYQIKKLFGDKLVEDPYFHIPLKKYCALVFQSNGFRQPCHAQAQNISQVTKIVQKLINDINQELQIISFKISQNMIGLFHIFAMILTWKIFREFYKLNLSHIRFSSLRSKEFWQQFYIGSLTNKNSNQDNALAQILSKIILLDAMEYQKSKAQEGFKSRAKKQLEIAQRRTLISQLDERLLGSYNDQSKHLEIFEYIVTPRKVIQKSFDNKIGQFLSQSIQISENQFQSSYEIKIRAIFQQIVQCLYNSLPQDPQKSYCMSLFHVEGTQKNKKMLLQFCDESFEDIPPTRLMNHNKSAVMEYFLAYLGGKQMLKQIEIQAMAEKSNGEKGQITLVVTASIDLPKFQMEGALPQSIYNKINQQFRGSQGQVEGITNLKEFLKHILDNFKNQQKSNPLENVKTEVRKQFFQKFVGCGYVCLKCKRVCDKDHQSSNYKIDKHECRLSHQPQCFGGFSWRKSGICDLSSCQCYPDSFFQNINGEKQLFINLIQILGQRKTWQEWKGDQMFEQWNFQRDPNDKYEETMKLTWERMKKAWDAVGRKVCKRHKMKFQSFKNPIQLHGIPLDPF